MSGTEPDEFTPLILLIIAVSAILTFVFMKPLLPAGTFTAKRGLPSTVLLRGLANGTFIGVETFLPLLLQLVHGWDPASAGLVLTVGSITWAIGSAVSGRITDQAKRAQLPVIGTLVQLVGTAITFAGVFEGVPGAAIIIGWTITGLGIGLIYPTMTVHALAMTKTRNKGKTSSALQMAATLGGAFCLPQLPSHQLFRCRSPGLLHSDVEPSNTRRCDRDVSGIPQLAFPTRSGDPSSSQERRQL